MSHELKWYCRFCGVNANIELWTTALSIVYGSAYLCKTCCCHGYLTDPDAPVQVTEEEMDEFWYELQNGTLI